MKSQRSGPGETHGSERASMWQGVYEENLRTRQGKPSPRHDAQDTTSTDDAATRGWAFRWGVALALVFFVLATGYATGGGALVQQRLFPAAQGRAASTPPPVADSLRGRAAPFTTDAEAAAEARAPAFPMAGGKARSVAGLFGLEVKTVVIDPGHGGEKDGAVGPGGTKEKHVALDVARRLQQRLRARYDYRVLLTRTGDEHQSLRQRVEFANHSRADLFVSIHVNSLPDPDVTSVETYYYGQESSDEVRRLARQENQASGYSVAEFNRLLEDVGRRMRRQESERLAGSIQKSLFRNIHGRNPAVRDWGVRTAPFVVLLGVEAPSVLAEIGVLSNTDDEAKLRRPAYRAALARFLEEGIAHYLGSAARPDSTAPMLTATPADSAAQ